MPPPILMVDDELKVLNAYERNLAPAFDIAIESNPEIALQRLVDEGPFAVIVTDFNMPRMNGNELLRKATELAPDTVRIMLTGYADLDKTIAAVNEGAVFRFLTKPCPQDQLQRCLDAALRQYQLVNAEKELLNKTLNGSIQMLVELLSISDPLAFSLAQKRRSAVKLLVPRLAISNIWALEVAALLSDIGIFTLPEDTKKRYFQGERLSEDEKGLVASLPEISAKLLHRIPRMEGVAEILKYQKKNYDGSGLPDDGVKESAIPQGARIIRILNDYFRALSQKREPLEAMRYIKSTVGSYDLVIVQALDAAIKALEAKRKANQPPRKLLVSEIRPGQTLRSDLFARDGTLILKTGETLGSVQLERIRNFQRSVGVKEPILIDH